MNHQRSEQSLSFQERGSRGEVLAGKYTVVRVYAKSFPDNVDPDEKKNRLSAVFLGKRIILIHDTGIFLKVRRIHSSGGPHPLIPSPEKRRGGSHERRM